MADTIPPEIIQSPVEGFNLREGTFGDQLGDRPTLLVFLRHFGCMFCREMVRDLRKISQEHPGYPPVLFVFQGSVADGKTFFDEFWPEARAIADLPKKFYSGMGLRRATFTQIFGVQVWTCGFRAMSKGNFVGKVIGDPWIMPGAFLVQGDQVLWCHRFAHQGDHPDWAKIPEQIPVTAH